MPANEGVGCARSWSNIVHTRPVKARPDIFAASVDYWSILWYGENN